MMIYKVLSSYVTTIILFFVLAVGAAVGTFIENDFGSIRAQELVYHNLWYHAVFLLGAINLVIVIIKYKLLKVLGRGIFHAAFVVILIGAIVTHYFSIDGLMHISEGDKSNLVLVGEEKIETPFYLALKDFTLTRYPGSDSPSEFSSKITLIDELDNEKFDTEIYMNNTFIYKGYKLFQTSYPNDEKGTILTVNKDPGVEITYLGYAMLFLGLLFNLFDKKSRFQLLVRKIKRMSIASFLLPLFLFCSPASISAQEHSSYVQEYLTEHKEGSVELSSAFGSLIVQGPNGRMKPIDTQNREVLNKLTGSASWQGMNANQVIMGLFSKPKIWKKVNIIKVKTPKLKKLLGVETTQKLVKFTDFFDEKGDYKLGKEVERANKLAPSKRGTFDRDLIKVDERLNILFMSYRGVLLKVFPLPKDSTNKWVDFKTFFSTSGNNKTKISSNKLLENLYNRNYDKGFEPVESIKAFQDEFGSAVMPTQNKLKTEVKFNNIGLFIKLSIGYLLFGLSMLIFGLSSIFYNKLVHSRIKNIIIIIAVLLLIIHAAGIAVRWYIGGYIPITSTYETMIYIAFSAILGGVLFFRKSIIALGASTMMAGIFLFAAYLGEIDPEITSLVPVLKSYWLSIHVSVITASYGFFGISAIIGVITLLLFRFRNENRLHIDSNINNLNFINEASLIIGLILLVIGNFLGGIWANESWGRYWGWDPKETWAYISILVYAVVLHIRLIKKIYSPYLFTVLSIVSFFSILMTYYGVNFYLAGLHSYATGDPVPIPSWVYYLVGSIILLIAITFNKRKLQIIKK